MTFVTDVLKMDLTASLEKVVVTLGYTSLKQEQKDAIKEFVKGHDGFVCLYTHWLWQVIMLYHPANAA